MSITSDPVEVSLAERFEAQVEQFADRVAINSAGRSTTYGELNGLANINANALLNEHGEPGEPGGHEHFAAVLVDQGLPLTTAIFASLKAGRAYVPLDPNYPAARIATMLEDSGAQVLLTSDRHEAMARQIVGGRVPILNIDRAGNPQNDQNPGLTIDPRRLAYILYTSGSTGKPKGVMIDQRSVMHNMLRHVPWMKLTEHDRATLLYPCSVYGGMRDVFNALLNGMALYHYPVKEAGTMGLADWLIERKITLYCSIVTIFRHFARELKGKNLFPDLRLVKFGGEASTRNDIELFRKHFRKACGLLGGLGATETGMSCHYLIKPDVPLEDGCNIPAGHAFPGVDVRVVDGQRKPVKPGVIGDIIISSRYIMNGYFGRPDLTEKVLLPDPDDPEARIFLTGDLGEFNEEGLLTHRGRKDQQVKIRGNRVEMLEVETVLSKCAGIREAAVTARPNKHGDMRLIGYIIPKELPGPTIHAIRAEMRQKLPSFMVPNTFVHIEKMPLTPNGKTERKSLPEPDPDHIDTGTAFIAPETDLEKKLAMTWQKVLGLAEVGVTDSFFDLGGDSLLAVNIVLEAERELDRSLPLSVFYASATIRQMAAWLEGDGTAVPGQDVVCLKASGTKPPLFCLPGRGGTAFSYRGLAELLDDDRPIFALQYPGLHGEEQPYDNIEGLAKELLGRVRGIRPNGPILLAGYSFGGLVAYEVAHQLRQQGGDVPYLAMFDTFVPGAVQPRPKLQKLWLHLKDLTPRIALQRLREVCLRVVNSKKNASKTDDDQWFEDVGPMPAGEGQITDALSRLRAATLHARRAYRPRPYDGELCLFKSSHEPDWMRFVTVAKNNGWSDLVRGRVHVYPIPGEHLEIFDAAHAPMLAEQVRTSLNRIADPLAITTPAPT
jgi:amino acid adenylation domain-containing protein